MYSIIEAFIDHVWETTGGTGDQAYIYAISGLILIVFVVKMVDLITSVFRNFIK